MNHHPGNDPPKAGANGPPPEPGPKLQALTRRLGHKFKNPGLLEQALRHRSYAHEYPEAGPSNERLEFLGDAVLSVAVSDLLLRRVPGAPEGELSRLRAALVNARQLAVLGRELDLGPHLLLGRGEQQQAGHEKPSLLANCLEAVMGAIFLDGGFAKVQRLISRWFAPLLDQAGAAPSRPDSKTQLQEYAQAHYRLTPTYRLAGETGPAHARTFRIEVRLGAELLATGEGPTKKQAAQQAARLAMAVLSEEI